MKMKVYIIDDEIHIAEGLVKYLESDASDCCVVGYSDDPRRALDFIRTHPVDLVLTDIYMPEYDGLQLIRDLRQEFPDILVIVVSAFDRFHYIKEALQYGIINYLLKPIEPEELRKCLDNAAGILQDRQNLLYDQDKRIFRDSIFQSLLRKDCSIRRLQEQCNIAELNIDISGWQILIADIAVCDEKRKKTILRKCHENEVWGYYCFLDTNMNLIFLLYGDKVSDRVWRTLRMIQADTLLKGIKISVGKPLETWHHIADSYAVTNAFLKAGFLFGKDILQPEEYDYEKCLEILQKEKILKLTDALIDNDSRKIMRFINQRIALCPGGYDKKNMLICFAVRLVNSISSVQEIREMLGDDHIDQYKKVEHMLKWMEHFCEKLVLSMQQNENKRHPCVIYAQNVIHERYMDNNLSLSEIAEKRMISSSYLGKIFKEQTGESFNEYLMRIRLEKVLDRLESSDDGIGVIAVSTGFTRQSYLNRVFRNQYGLSPVEYRRKQQESRKR